MKFYKKVLLVALPFAFLLTGCDNSFGKKFEQNVTDQERIMVNYMYNQCYGHQKTVRAAIENRLVRPNNDAKPFSDPDVLAAVKFWDINYGCYKDHRAETFQKDKTYNKIYENTYGEPLYVISDNNVIENDKPTTPESAVVVVEKVEYISPELIDKLTESVSSCFNAKVKTLELMDQNDGLLTSDNYEEVMKLVMKCKTSKLRQEVERVQ